MLPSFIFKKTGEIMLAEKHRNFAIFRIITGIQYIQLSVSKNNNFIIKGGIILTVESAQDEC